MLITKDIMNKYSIIFQDNKYMSQIFGHTPNTEKLSHKSGKSIINVIFALPSDLKVLFSPSFISTVWHPWIDAASFGTVRKKRKFLLFRVIHQKPTSTSECFVIFFSS